MHIYKLPEIGLGKLLILVPFDISMNRLETGTFI